MTNIIRDKYKDIEYFSAYIKEEQSRIDKFETKLQNNEVREGRIYHIRKKIFDLRFQIFIARYSMGDPAELLLDDYQSLAQEMKQVWTADLYEDLVWMLSIGVMLEAEEYTFHVFKDLVIKNTADDYLCQYLIHSRYPEISYQNSPWVCPEPYKYLLDVINSPAAARCMKDYLENKWYSGHQDRGWHDCHKHEEKLYFGYWSFESGAVMKILGADDSSLKDVPYYPYDLVHFRN